MKIQTGFRLGKSIGLVLVFASFLGGTAQAGSECRILRGWTPSTTQLVGDLNGSFVPFVGGLKSWGLENFLLSLPVDEATLTNVRDSGWDIPNAFALYDFATPKHLKDFLDSKDGEILRDLQDGIFSDQRSHWVDIRPFQGTLMVDRAYRTLNKPIDWMGAGDVRISLHLAKSGVARKIFLGQLNLYALALPHVASTVGLKGHMLLVGDRYWVEFALFEEGKAVTALQNPYHRVKMPIEQKKWILTGNRGAVDYGSAVLVPVK